MTLSPHTAGGLNNALIFSYPEEKQSYRQQWVMTTDAETSNTSLIGANETCENTNRNLKRV
jgi:hypothetical protein